jgi:hypothetical protein
MSALANEERRRESFCVLLRFLHAEMHVAREGGQQALDGCIRLEVDVKELLVSSRSQRLGPVFGSFHRLTVRVGGEAARGSHSSLASVCLLLSIV